MELHKKFCPELPWSYLFSRLGGKYGDCSALHISWKIVCDDLIQPVQHKANAKKRKEHLAGASPEDIAAHKEIEFRYRAKRQMLTLRMRICRSDPLTMAERTAKVAWFCPIEKGCSHKAPYTKKGWLIDHLQTCHGESKNKSKEIVKKLSPTRAAMKVDVVKNDLPAPTLESIDPRKLEGCFRYPEREDPGKLQPASEVSIILLDTETTGLSNEDDIVQIALLDALTGDKYSTYVHSDYRWVLNRT